MDAPEPGAEQGRPTRQQVIHLLETGLLPPVLARFTGQFVAAEVLHECSDLVWDPDAGRSAWYRQLLPYGSYCTRCGWAANLPMPSIEACAGQIVNVLGPEDGATFADLLAAKVREMGGR